MRHKVVDSGGSGECNAPMQSYCAKRKTERALCVRLENAMSSRLDLRGFVCVWERERERERERKLRGSLGQIPGARKMFIDVSQTTHTMLSACCRFRLADYNGVLSAGTICIRRRSIWLDPGSDRERAVRWTAQPIWRQTNEYAMNLKLI